MTVLGEENLVPIVGEGRGYLIALWHGRMVLGLPHHRARDWYVLLSGSQDGDILHDFLERFGYRVIRGSTSQGGVGAVRQMLTLLRKGAVVIITPDGPRGPRHFMNPGLVWVARATGYPIVPIGFACDRAWYASSWDRFTLPRPWSRVVMSYGEPICVSRSANEAELVAAGERVREALLLAEQQGFKLLQREPDW
jgi:lysophospholipid acyltransferase (LPLAT)-like uncharacterized protein